MPPLIQRYNDGSSHPPRLRLSHSLWSLTKLPRDGEEWSLAEKCRRVREAGFEAAPIAQILIDIDGRLSAVNLQARVMFGLNQRDIGTPVTRQRHVFRERRRRLDPEGIRFHPPCVPSLSERSVEFRAPPSRAARRYRGSHARRSTEPGAHARD